MLVDLGLCDGKRTFAFTRSDQEETNIRSYPMDQSGGLEQRGNAFSARHARDGDDDWARAETKLSAKLVCGSGLGQSPSESFDIDPSTAGRDHDAVLPDHPMTFEKGSILVGL